MEGRAVAVNVDGDDVVVGPAAAAAAVAVGRKVKATKIDDITMYGTFEEEEPSDDESEINEEEGEGGGCGCCSSSCSAAPTAAPVEEEDGATTTTTRNDDAPAPPPTRRRPIIAIEATGFRAAAVRHLERTDLPPIDCLCVVRKLDDDDDDDDDSTTNSNSNNEWEEDDGANGEIIGFRRFVKALDWSTTATTDGDGSNVQRRRRPVRQVVFRSVDWPNLPTDDLERLFAQILPGHPTIRSIYFYRHTILAQYFRLLLDNLPRQPQPTKEGGGGAGGSCCRSRSVPPPIPKPPLDKLGFVGGPIDLDMARSMATAIRDNAMIAELHLEPFVRLAHSCVDDSYAGLSPEACQLICRAVPHNTNLRTLELKVNHIAADTLMGIAKSKTLKSLIVAGTFTKEGATSFLQQLRTNVTLEELNVWDWSFQALHPSDLEELITTYNYTLRRLLRNGVSAVDDSLRIRNDRIRAAVQQLEPKNYHVSPVSVWPRVLDMVKDRPTLLFRFLRRCDIDKLCDHLLRRPRQGRKKRGRTEHFS